VEEEKERGEEEEEKRCRATNQYTYIHIYVCIYRICVCVCVWSGGKKGGGKVGVGGVPGVVVALFHGVDFARGSRRIRNKEEGLGKRKERIEKKKNGKVEKIKQKKTF